MGRAYFFWRTTPVWREPENSRAANRHRVRKSVRLEETRQSSLRSGSLRTDAPKGRRTPAVRRMRRVLSRCPSVFVGRHVECAREFQFHGFANARKQRLLFLLRGADQLDGVAACRTKHQGKLASLAPQTVNTGVAH